MSFGINLHPYDINSGVYNFFFHPFHGKKTKTILSVITNIFISVISGGLWQIPFWGINRKDNKKIKLWNQQKTTSNIFSQTPTPPSTPPSNKPKTTVVPNGKTGECHFAQPDVPASFIKDLKERIAPFSDVIVHVELLNTRLNHTTFTQAIEKHTKSGKKVICVMIQNQSCHLGEAKLIEQTDELLAGRIPKESIVAGSFFVRHSNDGINFNGEMFIVTPEKLLNEIESKVSKA